VPEIRVREKKRGCDGTREVNEHDEEVRIASARPGSLTACLGSNSEQQDRIPFWEINCTSTRDTRSCHVFR
jgi:hypothetical protein